MDFKISKIKIKDFYFKHKRIISIASAVLFLIVLFLAKNGVLSKTFAAISNYQKNGLVYDNTTIGELVNKDTDSDGIPDWEESLYGLDPTKKETTPGIPDGVAIERLKAEQELNSAASTDNTGNNTENLTKTEQFSRELFSTVASLSQNGEMDQFTTDQISISLANAIKNNPQRKVYVLSNLKTTKDESKKSIKTYSDTIDSINRKYLIKEGNVLAVLNNFSKDPNNLNAAVLNQLDPIIYRAQNEMAEILKMKIPQSIAPLHLDFMNAAQRLLENLNDIKLFDTDPIMTLSAVSQFDKNTSLMNDAALNLTNAIKEKLSN